MRLVAVLGLAFAAVACGQQPTAIQAGSNINSGVVPISQPATYRYSLTLQAMCGSSFRLAGDSGQVNFLRSDQLTNSGQVYLGPGNWAGAQGDEVAAVPPRTPCATEGVNTGSCVGSPGIPKHFQANPCAWMLALTAT
jgi:hypothetical protein